MEAMLHEPKTWITLAFFLFFLFMAKVGVFRMIGRSLDDRSVKIKAELDEAVRLREEAQATLASYQQKQQEIFAEAEQILSKTKQDAELMARTARDELKLALEKRTRLAMERIAQAESKAVKDVQGHMVDIAMAASRAIIKEYVAQGGNEEMIKSATADIERKLH
jgi:F-type H+-transporting ATPase subunit b